MILSDFLLAIRGFTKFTDPEVQTDALLISYLRMAEEKISSKLRCVDCQKSVKVRRKSTIS